jgi:tRNA-dihydrouridine synthase
MVMIGRAALGRPWLSGQVARYLATGIRESDPPVAAQFAIARDLYEEMLAHHGVDIGRRHARKHLAAALDIAGAQAGAAPDLVKRLRLPVVIADEPSETLRQLQAAFDLFSEIEASASRRAQAWRIAA